MHARTRCAVLVLSGLLVFAACNDDDDGDGAAIASSDTAGAAALAEAVETTAPSRRSGARPASTAPHRLLLSPHVKEAEPAPIPVARVGSSVTAPQ
jgi:hypothetical protein